MEEYFYYLGKEKNFLSIILCVCVCIYVYIGIYIHIYIHMYVCMSEKQWHKNVVLIYSIF